MAAGAVARVVLKNMGSNRGPGSVKAIIADGANIGCSTYRDSGGEFHMTLPSNHPAAGACEPWLTHYAVEELVNGQYKERFAGIISDFDATDDDVVVYGIDYLALLDLIVDSRYDKDAPKKEPPDGSFYSKWSISKVMNNLLNYARAKADSPVGFIDMGRRDTFKEEVTIYSTFVAIGPFLQGLVLSHRQGTGKRSRLWVEKYSGGYRFRVANNPGVERPALKMQYGGLVQGFQIIGFGDFATVAHGIGRTATGGELFYAKASAPAIQPSVYGSIETVQFHDNVAGQNDLVRRVKQHAAQVARVGKRAAMGIKVEGLSPFEGYGITDMIPVKIRRNIIDTDRFGSGWWSIHGVEWRIFPDGHTELTLAILPREDKEKPDANLLVDQEVLPTPLPAVIAEGSVTAIMLADGAVQANHLQSGAVGPDALAQGAVTGAAIADGSVDDADISSVGGDKITGDIIINATADEAGVLTPSLRILTYDNDGNLIGELRPPDDSVDPPIPGGFVMADLTYPQHMVRMAAGVVEYSVDGGETWLPAILGTGTVGDSITSGVLPGGHNVMPNAGFEMAPYATLASLATKIWTAAADWGATIGTDVNVLKTGTSLVMNDTTY